MTVPCALTRLTRELNKNEFNPEVGGDDLNLVVAETNGDQIEEGLGRIVDGHRGRPVSLVEPTLEIEMEGLEGEEIETLEELEEVEGIRIPVADREIKIHLKDLPGSTPKGKGTVIGEPGSLEPFKLYNDTCII